MLHKGSPDPMENSSGYVSNTNSMNPAPVKYATVGRSKPGGVKRTTSLIVSQPIVPPYKSTITLAPAPRKDVRKQYKNDLSRPSSRASRSSANSDPRRPSSRSSRDVPSERLNRHHRAGSRRSHSKVRRPESRTSSKALILRRRDSGRRTAAGAKRSASIRSGRSDEQRNGRPSSRTSQNSHRSGAKREPARNKPSIFASWKPRLTLRRSKSLQVKPDQVQKREIRFGDEQQPEVIMMKGVETRSRSYSASQPRSETYVKSHSSVNNAPSKRVSQTLTRPSKRTSPPSRSDRAASAEVSRRLAPVGESAQEDETPRSPRARRYQKHEVVRGRTSSLSPGKQRAPSEMSSSPPPRAPVWRDDSEGSLSDTLTNRSKGSTVRSNRRSELYSARQQRSNRSRTQEPPSEPRRSAEKSSVMSFLRRTFSIKPKEKPAKPAAIVKKRERASSSSLSSLERPVRHSKMKTAKSHELLNVPDEEYLDEKDRYRSLPRHKAKNHSSGTTLSRRLSSLGWAATGGRSRPERSRSFKDEKTYEYHANNAAPSHDSGDTALRNNERVLPRPAAPPKATNETSHGQLFDDELPIRPILQERRALSQPSLYHPPAVEPSDEPFSHYANLPFQLPPRRRSSPNLLADAEATAQRATSQPSLRARRSATPDSSRSSSTIHASDRQREKRAAGGKRPPGKSILKQQKSDEVKNVNVTKDEALPRKQKSSVFQGIAHNIKNVFKHRKAGDKPAAGEGFAAAPGDGLVSERYVNVTSTHEETESAREEEEIHPLGDGSHQGLSRAIRDGVDARDLVRSDGGRQRSGQRRLLHQSGKTWRTVDTDDTHETSRRDRHGDLVTESARTQQREQFQNLQVPDSGPELPQAGVEESRTSTHTRRHTKDVDMLEHFSVPRGGRLGDGIKLGDGLRYVQENVEEDHQGDPGVGGMPERMREMRHLDFRPNGQTSTPVEYPTEEKGKQHQTSNWLDNHFGSESGHSRSSEEDRHRGNRSPRDERDHRREKPHRHREDSGWKREDMDKRRSDAHRQRDSGRHRETSTYEYQRSSGTTKKGSSPPKSWEKSERYNQEIHETPEKTYVREAHHSSRGGGHGRIRTASEDRRELISDMQSEVDEDPIFASKFSSGKSRGVPRGGGVVFGSYMSNKPVSSAPTSPQVEDPPAPSPPPRHKRKNRLKQSPPQSVPLQKTHSAPVERDSAPARQSDPRRERRESPRHEVSHRATREVTPSRHEEPRRTAPPETVTSSQRLEDGRLVKEYHFRSSESPRDTTPVYREYRESSGPRRDSPQRPARRGSSAARESPPTSKTYFGQRNRSHSTDEPDGRQGDARYTATMNTRLDGGDTRRFHRSTDELDRRPAEPAYRSFTVDRRLGKTAHQAATQDALQSQTLPRKPREQPPTTRNVRRSGSPNIGGSMINVSVKNNVRGTQAAPRKPDRSPVRRSNSLYSRDGQPTPPSVGLKSPNILSQIQRTASVRRDSEDSPAPPPPPPPPAPATTHLSPMRAFQAEQRRNRENESRSSVERTHVIPVSVTPPGEEPLQPPRSPTSKIPPKVAPKPQQGGSKDKFMRNLMQTAPELYSALHKDERKDSKTPSPKQSPPMTPPPPLHRARSPASPQPLTLDYGVIYPKTPPVFKRIEALRADEEVVTKDGRSRSTTPAEDVANFRLGTLSPTGERSDVIKVQR